MIALHRLTHPESVVFLNPDLIQTIEATPDTVVTLTTASKLIVIEKPFQIADLIREWRASILTRAMLSHDEEAAHVAQVMSLAASRVAPADETA